MVAFLALMEQYCAGKQAEQSCLDGGLGAEIAAGEEVRTTGSGGKQAVVEGIVVYRGAGDRGEGKVPGKVDGDGRPEASGVDKACGIQEGCVHGYAGGADDCGSRGRDVKDEKRDDQYGEGEVAAQPIFDDAEENADDQDLRNCGIDEGIPEVGQQGEKGAGCGDGKGMGEVLDEYDRGGEGGAEQDAGGEVLGKLWGGELGDPSFFEALIKQDVDRADEEREDGAGDGVFVCRGEGGAG